MEAVFHAPPSQDLIDAAGPQQAVEIAPAEEAEVACSGELPLVGKGPNGEEPTPLSELSITPEEAAKIKEGNYKAAIAMHYSAAEHDGFDNGPSGH